MRNCPSSNSSPPLSPPSVREEGLGGGSIKSRKEEEGFLGKRTAVRAGHRRRRKTAEGLEGGGGGGEQRESLCPGERWIFRRRTNPPFPIPSPISGGGSKFSLSHPPWPARHSVKRGRRRRRGISKNGAEQIPLSSPPPPDLSDDDVGGFPLPQQWKHPSYFTFSSSERVTCLSLSSCV